MKEIRLHKSWVTYHKTEIHIHGTKRGCHLELLFHRYRNSVRHEYKDHEYHDLELEHLEAQILLRSLIFFDPGLEYIHGCYIECRP